ncbi:Uncharacterised protein [Zhongshania aliphaticivorans]|uniref:Antitoxin n=2 Tax=Zhongshania aliphaticivorans TaxID=1470434 RepID=A0A5S9Q5A5_9GAMM|nr:Uncharacterised protein [Zhongshania aliphaticivorans]CAA0112113.1 Uncharacterised protein [Zhongshania aliphaticivorans]
MELNRNIENQKEKVIPISRLRREFNSVIRNIMRGKNNIYAVTRKDKPVVYLVKHELYLEWLDEVEKIQAHIKSLEEMSSD